MTSAYVLIFAVLVLGGILAALGDRLGSKVGKARLRLFNLRPKQTAIVVTVMTGTLIAASTLGLLFAMSKSLRQGVFQLDQILSQRRQELLDVTKEKAAVEKQLEIAIENQQTAATELRSTEERFQAARRQLATVKKQADALRGEIANLSKEQEQLRQQRDQLKVQSEELRVQVRERDNILATQEQELQEQNAIIEQRSQQIEALKIQQNELQGEIETRDATISSLDAEIASKDEILSDLENQIAGLQEQIKLLEASYLALRSGNVTLTTGQVLSFGVVRIIDPQAANQAVDQLLREANRNAVLATRLNPDTDERVVQITNAQVEQLINEISDGRDYVVRMLSAGNYVQGEKTVQVFADAVLNQRIFRAGETIATISLEELEAQDPNAQSRPVDFLLRATQFRARRAGILGDIQVEDGRVGPLIEFAEALNELGSSITEIRAIATNAAFTAGPLKLELVAISNGNIVLRTSP